MFPKAIFPVLFLFGAALASTASQTRGVPPELQEAYSSPNFKCMSGNAVGNDVKINDDFCDCVDGSDEPATPACAGRTQAKFYCRNRGHQALSISTTKVHDGICDCCDGSDEPTGFCNNECLASARIAVEASREKYRAYSQGLSVRATQEIEGKNRRQSLQKQIESLQEQLAQIKADQLVADAELEEARKAEEEERRQKEEEERKRLEEEERRQKEEERKRLEEEERQTAANSTAAESTSNQPNESAQGDASESARDEKNDVPVETPSSSTPPASDHTPPSTEGEESGTPPPPVPSPPPRTVRREVNLESRSTFGEILDAVSQIIPDWIKDWNPFRRTSDSSSQIIYPGAEQSPAVLAALEKRNSLTKQEWDVKHSIEVLKETVEKQHGPDEAYFLLDGPCFDTVADSYTYRFCPFHNASQIKDSTTMLGHYGSWRSIDGKTDYTTMLLLSGQPCVGGISRTATIMFECGEAHELLGATEPRMCEYSMRFRSPVACRAEDVTALKAQLDAQEAELREIEDESSKSKRTEL